MTHELNQEKLVEEAQQGVETSEEIIYQQYKKIIKIKAHMYSVDGADVEDLMQEGMIGLFKAIKNFEKNKNVSFRTFAEKCINNQIITAIKKYSRKKHIPLNYSISLEKIIQESEQANSMELFIEKKYEEPETALIMKENIQSLNGENNKGFSAFESRVIIEILHGKSYKNIAKTMNKSEKSIENAVQRLRKKLEIHLKK